MTGLQGRLVQSSLGIQTVDTTAEVDISEMQQIYEKMMMSIRYVDNYSYLEQGRYIDRAYYREARTGF